MPNIGVSLKKALIIPDCHIPFHNKKAYELMLKVAKDFKPDEIVILGDFADFFAVNSHGKNPKLHLYSLLSREVDEVKKELSRLDRLFPRARKIFIEGNHEDRLTRFIANKAYELFGTLQLLDLLELRSRPRWTFIPYQPRQLYKILGSKLNARHKPFGPNARTSATKGMCNLIFGHTHQIQEWQVVSADGSAYRAMSCGWLGDHAKQAFSYVDHCQWQHGFGLVYVQPNGNFHFQTVHIINYKCVFNGKLYSV